MEHNRTYYYVKDIMDQDIVRIIETGKPLGIFLGDKDYNTDDDGELHNNCVFAICEKEIQVDCIKQYKKDNLYFYVIKVDKTIVNIDKIIDGQYSKAFKANIYHPSNLAKAVINKNPKILELIRSSIYADDDPDRYIVDESFEYDSIPNRHEEIYEDFICIRKESI